MSDYPNWFAQTAQHNFEQFLLPFKGEERLLFLQLGAYTGDASEWLLDNVLTGAGCRLIDVDTWRGSDEEVHKDMDFAGIYNLYLDRVGGVTEWYRSTSFEYLTRTIRKRQDQGYPTRSTFDFIYIDADHTTVGVILDAELSWPLLESGGIMAFDDYTWGHESGDPRLAPMVGIDLFLHRHQGDYELLAKNDQVWIKKR